MKSRESNPDVRDMAQARHILSRAAYMVADVEKFLNSKPDAHKPRVMLSDGGSHYMELSIESIAGPEMDNPWHALILFLASMKTGNGRIMIQLGADHETRMTQLVPLETLQSMSKTIKEANESR